MTKANNNFDVIIAGGGMVGTALACALHTLATGEQKLRIALVEAHVPLSVKSVDDYGLRVSALSRASERVITRLAVWDAIKTVRVSPYQRMHVWDANGNGSVDFDAADIGEPNLGHIVENALIQHSLWQRAQSLDNVICFAPAKAQDLAIDGTSARLTLDNGQVLQAPLVVGADGAASKIRKLANLPVHEAAYEQYGVVTRIQTQKPHTDTAWQRFLSTGPLAFLPLADGSCSIVWSTSDAHSEALLAMDEKQFCQAVTQASETILGEVVRCSERARFPLRKLHAENYVTDRVALVGDAAHVVHPLAGQGVNMGFLDVAVLAEILVNAQTKGRDVGALSILRKFERARQSDNQLTLRTLDGLHYLFGEQHLALPWLRNTGMQLFDRLTPLKNHVIRRAMGLSGDLPPLAK
ncbi:MAG TPA: UbiH/UbiF/VisC/COQ6 family ubiquinone biosynthesis hydroxylase [Gammaproteobacteria bacterium]|nr:UbiH/UbiF/VisC/COQ6 family ubiquinone biosynthesis hydroxylase [Gammaproteobacteria bacterium]